jgi:hypothetical protein
VNYITQRKKKKKDITQSKSVTQKRKAEKKKKEAGVQLFHQMFIPLTDRGIKLSRAEGGCSKLEVSAAMALDFDASIAESGVVDFGYSFLITGGGVERFLALELSKVAASALKAGDLPLTRTRSGLTDMLREERCWDLSGTLLDLPPYVGVLRFGF